MILLVSTIPVLAITDNIYVPHAIGLVSAMILANSVIGLRSDFATVSGILRPFFLAMAFPALWMILQIVPIPASAVVNSVWAPASTALSESLTGRIAIDPGGTLRSLTAYLAALSLIVSTLIISRDRRRAETLFYVLTTVTTFMSAEVLIARFDGFAGLIPSQGSAAAAIYLACAALALLANVALALMTIQHYLIHRGEKPAMATSLLLPLLLATLGAGISLSALRSLGTSGFLAIVALGVVTIAFIAAARRVGLPRWISVSLFVVIAAVASTAAVTQLKNASSLRLVAFLASGNNRQTELSQRMLNDTPWLGNGVGSFRVLTPIYREFGTVPAREAPSTAISIAIEWGKPALIILVAIALQLFVFMLRGAISRGRDSYFASFGAAALLVLSCEAFLDPSLLTLAVQMLGAVILGLSLSQSVGRTSGTK